MVVGMNNELAWNSERLEIYLTMSYLRCNRVVWFHEIRVVNSRRLACDLAPTCRQTVTL
jgi:hypothetical protein